MIARLIGDIHYGKRFPFTTAQTAKRFDTLRNETVAQACNGREHLFLLGDLFDSFSVSADTLIQGFSTASRPNCYVLSGNHDKSNNTDKNSALEYLGILGNNVVWDNPRVVEIGDTYFVMVPHQLTQERFEQVLDEVGKFPLLGAIKHRVLLLHCNFGDREGTVTENYLRPEMAQWLLSESFDLIVSGHEHNFNRPMKGVIMLGSILPFSFGEMKTKYVLDYDCTNGSYEVSPVWDDSHYIPFTWRPDNVPPVPKDFIELRGEVGIEQAAAINKQIAEWYKNGQVISVKNATALVRHDKEVSVEKAEHWADEVKSSLSEAQRELLASMLEATV